MPDFPIPRWPALNVITPWSVESLGVSTTGLGTTAGIFSCASAVHTANRILYFPFLMYETAQAVKMSYLVGATANGNVDVGIYDDQKNRLVNSGSTAQGTINTLQELDITDTTLTPGRYFMAITLSSGTGTWFRINFSDEIFLSGIMALQETPGSFGLPTTAAWANSGQTSVDVVAMGVHFNTLI